MASFKLIAVLGATGNQGGSVVSTFLEEPGWQVRALTRNTSSPKAQALVARGAQVAYVDLDKPETFEAAFKDVHAIFAVSDFWGLYGDPTNKDKAKPGQPLNAWAAERETQQLTSVIDAAAKVPTLERFVFSSLANVSKWSGGKYTHVYHFDSKARAAEYGQVTYPDLWKKTSIFQAGMFLSNYVSIPLMKVFKNEEGTVQFIGHVEPDVKLPFIAVEEDTGPIVKALVNEPAGKNIIAYRGWLTMPELAQTLTQATGLRAEYVRLPQGEFPPTFSEEMKQELGDTFAAFNELGYESRNDPTVIHPQDLKSPPSLDTVDNYWKKQDWPKVLDASWRSSPRIHDL